MSQANYKWIIEPKYKDAWGFSDGLAQAKDKNHIFYINTVGEIAIDGEFSEIKPFSEGLAAVRIREDGDFGYIDKTGDLVIEPQFTECDIFIDGIAKVKHNYKWGFIDKKGNFIINPQFQEIHSFSGGLAAIKKDDKWGFINKTGQIVIKPQFVEVRDFSDGLAPARKDYGDKFGFIDQTGQYVIKPQFWMANEFSEGLALVKRKDSSKEKFGYIDKSGQYVIKPQFDYALNFSDGLAAVSTSHRYSGTYGYIDKTGQLIIPEQFDREFIQKIYSNVDGSPIYGVFVNGYVRVKQNGKLGIIDKKGKYIVNPAFEGLGASWEGILAAKQNGLWGYISIKNIKPVISEKPIISWEYPSSDLVSEFDVQNLKACITSKSKITDVSLYIDNKLLKVRDFEIQPVSSRCDYHFEKQIQFKETNHKFTISLSVTNSTGTTTSSRSIEISKGDNQSNNYQALLIAEEDYDDPNIKDLQKPVSDAKELQNILESKYGFTTTLLTNPNKSEIVNELIKLRSVDNEANILIYYGGHGKMDGENGFWLPSDAQKKDQSTWLSTKDISSYIKSIPSRHTLAIVDACYGGTLIMREDDDISKSCEVKGAITSRNAITSGTKVVVPDESVFIKYLTKKLNENKQNCMPADELWQKIQTPVINNSPIKQVPQYGTIPSTGDEGGSFIFILKK